jgi:alpha,alpha-trehalose phosphorylase
MLQRDIVLGPKHIYPPDEWRVIETRFTPEHFHRTETIYALSNGYVGIRATFDEGRPVVAPGTFLNGFHETWPIVHAEEAYGLARTGQTIVAVPDATILQLYVDDEPLFLPTARLTHYERTLDMRGGTMVRAVVWSTAAGKQVRVRSTRMVSLRHRHVAAIEYEVTILDGSAPVAVASRVVNQQDVRAEGGERYRATLDPRLAKAFPHRVLHQQVGEAEGNRFVFGYSTANSGMTMSIGVDHVIESSCPCDTTITCSDDVGELVVTTEAQPGAPIRITKYITYQHSRSVPVPELVGRCRRTLNRVVAEGFPLLLEAQRDELDRFWDRADVRVQAYPDARSNRDARSIRFQQAIRWNLFQLAQASWRAEGSGIPAKGLTGQAYEGHYFWDTEVYVLPFLAYTQPRIARTLLRFRHSMLDKARARAEVVSQRGALFPWRTINGEEASGYYQAGTAQYHINADIAHAVRKYADVTGDVDFLVEVGAELVIETARLWADLGFFGVDGRFHIHSVTGPDEYTTVVNDNAYTNLMARLNLNTATSIVRLLRNDRPDGYVAVAHACSLDESELDDWERAATAMYVPYDDERGIHAQDESFLDREVWNLAETPREKFPLLLHYHPLVIYRSQVLKQADVVLAMFLLGNEYTIEQKRRNFEYYDALTTGDSSLSACVQSIVAAEIGKDDEALAYFRYALLMDLGDVAGNVSDGVHVAAAGGVWMALVFGFGGVRDFGGDLSFDPRLPTRWQRLAFSLRFRDRQVRVTIAHDEERYEIDEGEPLDITIRGKPHVLRVGRPVIVPPPAPKDRSPTENRRPSPRGPANSGARRAGP